MGHRSVALACAALVVLGCAEEPAPREARPVDPPVLPASEPAPEPPAGRAVWIDASGKVRESAASSERVEEWNGAPIAGLRHLYAALPGDRLVAGVQTATDAEVRLGHAAVDVRILDRAGGAIEVGAARRVLVRPDARFIVLERFSRDRGLSGSSPPHSLHAFDVEGRSAHRIGLGSFLAFDDGGRAIGRSVTWSIGPNDMPVDHRAALTVSPMPGDTRPAPPLERVPLVGPRGRLAQIDLPPVLPSGRCTLRIGAVTVPIRGHVCDRLDPIAWAPDESAIALFSDDGQRATLRVLGTDGRELGTYDAGSLDLTDPAASLGRIAFTPDASELALQRPDGVIVRIARDGRLLAELGSGALRGYDPSGRYLLIVAEKGARIAGTREASVRELGPAADAAWLPPAP